MTINWYRLGSRNDFIASELPQQYLDEYVEGLPVRIDLSQVVDRDGVTISNINVVYDGYCLPSRLRGRGYTYVLEDKYGAIERNDGFIYLGVKSES